MNRNMNHEYDASASLQTLLYRKDFLSSFQCLADFAGISATTLGRFRTSATFSTDNRCRLLNNFVRLKFRCHLLRNRSDQRYAPINSSGKKDWTGEFGLQCIGDRTE